MKIFAICAIVLALASCTTLSNRRDLYMPNHEIETQPPSPPAPAPDSRAPNPPARSPGESQIVDPEPE